jgi:GxxExxY protein
MDENESGRITKSHQKQILTYLRLTHMKLGFLLNFGAAVMKEGITRTVDGLDADR